MIRKINFFFFLIIYQTNQTLKEKETMKSYFLFFWSEQQKNWIIKYTDENKESNDLLKIEGNQAWEFHIHHLPHIHLFRISW